MSFVPVFYVKICESFVKIIIIIIPNFVISLFHKKMISENSFLVKISAIHPTPNTVFIMNNYGPKVIKSNISFTERRNILINKVIFSLNE